MPAAKWLSSLYCRDFYIVLQYLLNSFWALLTSKLSFSAVCWKQKPLQIPYQAMEAIAGTLCNAILLFRNKRNIEQFSYWSDIKPSCLQEVRRWLLARCSGHSFGFKASLHNMLVSAVPCLFDLLPHATACHLSFAPLQDGVLQCKVSHWCDTD